MERINRRQQRTVGAVVKIPLERGFHTYARILEVEMAFYNIHTKKELTTKEIINTPVLFITTVYDNAITKGYWPKISKAIPLEDKLIDTPAKYTQDVLNPLKYSLVYSDKKVEAKKEECKGLEFWAIWSAENIEKRLNDHFFGRKNLYVERMNRAEMYDDLKLKTKKINLHKINKEAV